MVTPVQVVYRCGLVPYRRALESMRALWLARRDERIGDVLLLLEHPPVITLGMSGGLEDLRLPVEALERQGIECIETERGGRATLHSPGQLVVYPVHKLENGDLHRYLWQLEETVLWTLAGWGIAGERLDGKPGVWVRRRKIAALGLAVRAEVVYHGLALNVNNDLSYYEWIHPCGFHSGLVTSMQVEAGIPVSMESVIDRFLDAYSGVFGCRLVSRPPLEISRIALATAESQRC